MKSLNFKTFLQIIDEDLGGDIAKLQADLSNIDVQITQKTAPLIAQKQRLEKLLFQKRKEQQNAVKRENPAARSAPEGQPPSSQATTPGSTGAATPGQ